MGCFKVLFFISAIAVAYVSARDPGRSFGSKKEGTKQLVGKKGNFSHDVVVKFNIRKNHDVIIDQVDVKYEAGEANCRLIDGGPGHELLNLRISPVSHDYSMHATVIIYGRLNNGYNPNNISPNDLTFT